MLLHTCFDDSKLLLCPYGFSTRPFLPKLTSKLTHTEGDRRRRDVTLAGPFPSFSSSPRRGRCVSRSVLCGDRGAEGCGWSIRIGHGHSFRRVWHVASARLRASHRIEMTESELAYNLNLRADVETDVNPKPRAKVHSVEWRKVMNGAWMEET